MTEEGSEACFIISINNIRKSFSLGETKETVDGTEYPHLCQIILNYRSLSLDIAMVNNLTSGTTCAYTSTFLSVSVSVLSVKKVWLRLSILLCLSTILKYLKSRLYTTTSLQYFWNCWSFGGFTQNGANNGLQQQRTMSGSTPISRQ